MWWLPLPALLLLASAGTRAEPRKAVVSLDPPWDRVLTEDSVTFTCRGADPQKNATRWFRNGGRLPNQAPTYSIAAASVGDSAEYRCRTDLLQLSDPVRLEVHAAWLLLQAPRWVLQEGQPLRLRCHSWRNIRVQKVQYFRDGRGRQFSYQNTEFHVANASRNHSGSYFCRGIIGSLNVSSEAVRVRVRGPGVPDFSPVSPPWPQVAFCLLMGLLFAVDTGLYVSVQRQLQGMRRSMTISQVTWSKSP